MPLVTITNKTSSRLPVGSTVGVLGPNKTIQLQLTSDELERSRDQLISLAASGNIEWSTSPTSTNEDNRAESVLGGAVVLAGVGAPNGSVIGSVGDLYVDKEGGASTTLYVKESGSATNTGWVAK
tara:strand:+ start:440 stop:814 length:375 start_codon:yes stop_codon:yes gene_type:complete